MYTLILNKEKVKNTQENKLQILLKAFRKETFIMYLLFCVVSIDLVAVFDKKSLHLIMNKYNSDFFDVFFKYATFLGDGFMFGVLALVFLLIKKTRKLGLTFIVSGVLTLFVTHLFKKILFKGFSRPVKLIGKENLHLIDGVEIAFRNSFPSGHTITAFAIFTILCLCLSKCKTQYIWVSFAIIAGLSRVYLSQHFLVDVFVGSFLGIIVGFASMLIVFPIKTD